MSEHHPDDFPLPQLILALILLLITSLLWAVWCWNHRPFGSINVVSAALLALLGVILLWLMVLAERFQKQVKVWSQHLAQAQATARQLRDELDQLRAQARQSQTQIERLQRLEASLPANLHHDFRSPIRVINGFCETLLAPRHELPAAFRGDIEAIQRSTQRLHTIAENVLAALDMEAIGLRPAAGWAAVPPPTASYSQPETQIAVLSASAAVINLFQRHFQQPVIGINAVAALEGLNFEAISAVIVADTAASDPIRDLRQRVPVLVCPLRHLRDAAVRQPISNFEQPFTAEMLTAALERLGRPIREVLAIDEDAHRVDQLSEYCAAQTPPVNLWKAYSGREGLALLHEQPMDAVIFDLGLTDVDGLTVWHNTITGVGQPTILVAGEREFAVMTPADWGQIILHLPDGYNGVELIAQLETLAVNLRREKNSS